MEIFFNQSEIFLFQVFMPLTDSFSCTAVLPDPTAVFLDTAPRNTLLADHIAHTSVDLLRGTAVHHPHKGRGYRGYGLHSHIYQKHSELLI